MQRSALHDNELGSADAAPHVPTGPALAAGVPALRTNPSDETVRLGPLAVRFLVSAGDSGGSVAVFEVSVPARQRLAAPAHSHDH